MSHVLGSLPDVVMPWARRPQPIARRRPERTDGAVRAGQERSVGFFDRMVFRSVLVRECSRSKRFNQPLGLLILKAPEESVASASLDWSAVLEALTAGTRDTDVVGWVEEGRIVGAILPELAGADSLSAGDLERRVRRELSTRLLHDAAASLSIRVDVHDPARITEAPFGSTDARSLSHSRRKSPVRDGVKRALDVAGSLLLLAFLLPLFLVLAASIKLTSPGPVFFRQRRVGENATPFTMLKFRTMRTGADHTVHQRFVTQFIKTGAQAVGANGIFKLTDDPRVTPVGRVLRRTSLDELPQFWNVLRGDMSLVGPRPPLAYELEQYQPWHLRRVLDAKPGVTGLWQVMGRSRTTFDEMVRLDLRYARSRGLWMDLKILLKTPAAVISGKGAC